MDKLNGRASFQISSEKRRRQFSLGLSKPHWNSLRSTILEIFFSNCQQPFGNRHAYYISEKKWKCSSLSRVQLFVIPWTAACQGPLSMGFPRQAYWSGLLPQGTLPDPGIEPSLLHCGQILYYLSHQESPFHLCVMSQITRIPVHSSCSHYCLFQGVQ